MLENPREDVKRKCFSGKRRAAQVGVFENEERGSAAKK
jgi:hypothetical protein